MAYRPLKPVMGVTGADPTGKNAGNLTTSFDPGTPGMPKINVWEIYHMTVTGGPPVAAADIILAGNYFSNVTLDGFGKNEWDPQQPAQVVGDQTMYYLWNIPVLTGAPGLVVTVWGRYDPADPSNAGQ